MPTANFAEVQNRLQQFKDEIRALLWNDPSRSGELYRLAYDENGEERPGATPESIRMDMGHDSDGAARQALKFFQLVLGERDLPNGPSQAQQWRRRVSSIARRAQDPGPAGALTDLAHALGDVVVAKSGSKEDTLRRDILNCLREHSEIGREEIAALVSADASKVYWELKELRTESEEGGPLVVARRNGQGGPLIYRMADDPEADARVGWFGIGGRGRAAASSRVRDALLEYLERHPGQTVVQIQESDEFDDHGNSQIYWGLRALRESGEVVTEGRPMRHRLVADDDVLTEAVHVSEVGELGEVTLVEGAGLDIADREEKARQWHKSMLMNFHVLVEEASAWIRGRLASTPQLEKQVTVTTRVKDEKSFSKKAARLCRPEGKMCRLCRQRVEAGSGRVREPHFYYDEETVLSSGIEDMVGIRIVVPTSEEKDAVLELLGDRFNDGSEAEEIGMDRDVPGYRGTHLILKLRGPDLRNPAFESVTTSPFEVQVRTAFQDAGARIEHALLYKDESDQARALSPKENRLLRTIFGQLEVAESEFDTLMMERKTGRHR